MKKSLLKSAMLSMALLASTSAYADVKLVFNGYDSDSSDSGASWTTSSELSTVFLEGAEYVASIDECSKVYAARNTANGHDFGGAKFGSSSAAGVITFTLAEPVNAKKIVVTAAPYGASEGQTGFICNEVETPMPDGQNKIYEDYEISLDGSALSTISLKQVKADKGRFYVKSITVVEATSEATGWDGTVSTSLDGTTITSLADLAGMTITFNGATSVVALGEEEAQYLILQNEDGSEMYGLWAPAYGSTCTVEGNVVTLDEFITIEGVTGPIPAGTTTLYIEDYGTFVIDGVEDYFPTIELAADIAGAAEPFMLTSVVNNGVAGNVVGVEAGEGGISYLFTVSAECALNAGTALPVLSLDGQEKFGTANIIAYGEKEAYIRFMETEQYYFTEPGTYVLSIPEGTFVNEEGTPNAAVSVIWVVIQNDQPTVTEIENVTVGVVTNDTYGSNDSYYTVTMKFNAPEGAAYAYCEGLMLSKDGEPSNIPFMLPDYGFIELDGTNLELVFTDMMKCATDDADYEGELREAGSYVGEANIYFMDADYMELASYAHYTGSLYFEKVEGTTAIEYLNKSSENVVYNLNGQKVEKVNGFVISNGKIMFVK